VKFVPLAEAYAGFRSRARLHFPHYVEGADIRHNRLSVPEATVCRRDTALRHRAGSGAGVTLAYNSNFGPGKDLCPSRDILTSTVPKMLFCQWCASAYTKAPLNVVQLHNVASVMKISFPGFHLSCDLLKLQCMGFKIEHVTVGPADSGVATLTSELLRSETSEAFEWPHAEPRSHVIFMSLALERLCSVGLSGSARNAVVRSLASDS
jgi:hypothetical protein